MRVPETAAVVVLGVVLPESTVCGGLISGRGPPRGPWSVVLLWCCWGLRRCPLAVFDAKEPPAPRAVVLSPELMGGHLFFSNGGTPLFSDVPTIFLDLGTGGTPLFSDVPTIFLDSG